MARILGCVAMAGFAIALLVHLMTFVPIDVEERFPLVWLLRVGIFVVFLPFLLFARRKFGAKPSMSDLSSAMPGWARSLAACVFIYAIVNFGLFFLHSEGGVPTRSGNEFALQSHGRLIRVLTESEYHLQKAYVVRGFSGHWLVFYLVPALYFLFGTRNSAARDA